MKIIDNLKFKYLWLITRYNRELECEDFWDLVSETWMPIPKVSKYYLARSLCTNRKANHIAVKLDNGRFPVFVTKA